MWKVSNGNNELWIFGIIGWIPEGMTWESKKVETVIARSEEYIYLKDSLRMKLPLNPITWYRGIRLWSRVTKNPDGATLKEVLPEELSGAGRQRAPGNVRYLLRGHG